MVLPSRKIAIVGMSCRFPGSYGIDAYWDLLTSGQSAVTEVTEERWPISKYYSEDIQSNKSVSKWAALVDGFDRFDADFFGVLPREAELMDPQQRISLELAVECLEDAGYGINQVKGKNIGVYLGVCNFDYKERLGKSLKDLQGHVSTGTYSALIPNRVSFFLDLKGPSIPVDTACSSSLVALSNAINAIAVGDCDSALVGGISYLFSHTYFVAFSQAGMLSPTGYCQSFDSKADGYVRGEGAGMVLIKPLEQAIKDNDQIYGVVDSVALNHGGSVSTVTSPSPFAQANVIKTALQKAEVSANSVSYIEAHGTGTPKGDPIEVNALKRAYRAAAQENDEELDKSFCFISSAKTNIGHLEAAAGIAGLIKGLLSIRHKKITPLVHFEQLNPRIKLAESPFLMCDKLQDWNVPTRRFGLSSFGFGGVNAHTIVSEYTPAKPEPELVHNDRAIFALSAESAEKLRTYASLISDYLLSNPDLDTHDCAYTLARRTQHPYRVIFTYSKRQELAEKLIALANGVDAHRIEVTSDSSVQADAMSWLTGDAQDLSHLFDPALHSIVHLPSYPFSHQEYFPEEILEGYVDLNNDDIPANCWQLRSTYDSVASFLDEGPEQAGGTPIVIAAVEASAAKYLSTLVPEQRLYILPDGLDDLSASDWVNGYLEVVDWLKEAIAQAKPQRCLLLSSRAEGFISTLYAHCLSFDKEFGLPCAWYQVSQGLFGEHAEKILQQKQAESAAYQIDSDANGKLAYRSLGYHIKPFEKISKAAPVLSRGDSVLITGGAGGIGRVFARYFAEVHGCTVTITGRRPNSAIAGTLPKLTNGKIEYVQADCCHREELSKAIRIAEKANGRIDVVMHSVGVIDDKSFFFKTEQDIRDVVEGKVLGCDLLDELTADLKVKHFIVYSSITGVLGNPGQTDYAASNSYLKSFVHTRNQKRDKGLRNGSATVIHWPYWQDGGMQIDNNLVDMLRETTGTLPLANDDGIDILEFALRESPEELCVVPGDQTEIETALKIRADTAEVSSDKPIRHNSDVQAEVLSVFESISGLEASELDTDARFSDLGIDSIASLSISRELSRKFDLSINSVTLARYPSVSELSDFIKESTLDDSSTPNKAALIENQHAIEKEPLCGIIGMSLKTAGGNNWRDGWNYLYEDSIKPEEYPLERWNILPEQLKRGLNRSQLVGYFLNDCYTFDYKFFSMSRREVMLMDPQQRLMIEAVWSALLDAGYCPDQFNKRKTAVYVCLDASDYAVLEGYDASVDEFSVYASTPYLSANRLSHMFNLEGPSETINVACASVYTAVEKASDLIAKGVVEQAVITSSQLNLLPSRFEMLAQRQLISPDNKVVPFDKSANGFVRSEGAGCVVLKSLTAAETDNDEVQATIRGAASWHGGKGSSLTTPNPLTHLSVIESTFAKSKADPNHLEFVEAHGTASVVGDLAEAQAISEFLKQQESPRRCVVSSMKSNIGHLEVCSGIAGFVRAVLTLKTGIAPGNPQLETLLSDIDQEHLIIDKNPQRLTESKDKLIGMLSYGMGGVSSFVLLESYNRPAASEPYSDTESDSKSWILLSADSEASLARYAKSFSDDIKKYSESTSIEVVANTLRYFREHKPVRIAIEAASYSQLLSSLSSLINNDVAENSYSSLEDLTENRFNKLPPWVAAWLAKDSVDVETAPAISKRSFWPQYPLDRSESFYISPSKHVSSA